MNNVPGHTIIKRESPDREPANSTRKTVLLAIMLFQFFQRFREIHGIRSTSPARKLRPREVK